MPEANFVIDEIKDVPGRDFSFQKRGIQLVNDEYVIHFVAKSGRVISKANQPMYREVIDLVTNDQGYHYVFRMSILDVSQLIETYPDMETVGICATFKLSNGYLKFVKVFDSKDFEDTKAFLCDTASHEFVRSRYEEFYETNFKKV